MQKSITDLYMHASFVHQNEHEDLSALYLDLSCMNEDCLANLSEWFALRRLCVFMLKFRHREAEIRTSVASLETLPTNQWTLNQVRAAAAAVRAAAEPSESSEPPSFLPPPPNLLLCFSGILCSGSTRFCCGSAVVQQGSAVGGQGREVYHTPTPARARSSSPMGVELSARCG